MLSLFSVITIAHRQTQPLKTVTASLEPVQDALNARISGHEDFRDFGL